MAHLTVLDGSTFFVSDSSGDVEAVRADGFFHADMRHLSTWRLLVDGESPRTLASGTVDYYSARVVGGVWQDGDDATIAVKRERFVSGGVHEDLIVENLTEHPQQVELVLDRDSMIMAYQLLPFQPRVVKTTLEVLAGLQATGTRRLPRRGAREDPA